MAGGAGLTLGYNNVEGGYSAPDSLVCCEGGTYDR